jgi:3-oxoacyl-[acyl-carrier protein] reductase
MLARDEATLIKLSREITKIGGKAIPFCGDVSQPKKVSSVVNRVQEKLGNIDILVNNSGIQPPIGAFAENDLDDWEYNFKVNLFGAVRLIHAVLPLMLARGRGKIINFSGGGATAPRPHFSAYAAAKAALVRFTETLAVELSPCNIQVNAVAPGAVNTDMLDEIIAAGEKAGDEYRQGLERRAKGGTPVEMVCELVLFLASQASGNLTGKLISAPHDPWRQWAGEADELNACPLFTMRRIDPFTIKPLIKDLGE